MDQVTILRVNVLLWNVFGKEILLYTFSH